MKYPNLVPARAINALSDWLVFNLEELGVEAPLVYSRLLLSLLHTTFHVNNIEQAADIPYFKEFLLLNKNYQVSQLDTEELKRFAAVNILIEATSNSNTTLDQDNSTIVDLVNELYNKIREIEKESTVAVGESSVNENNPEVEVESVLEKNDVKRECVPCSIEDRTKKYYSAFPALNKDAFGGKYNEIKVENPMSGLTSSSAASANESLATNTATEFTSNASNYKADSSSGGGNGGGGILSWSNVFNNNAINIGKCATTSGNSIKRKPKRKRSGPPGRAKSFYIKKQPSEMRDSLWDMNFEGTWEMGDDKISEFFNKTYKRNRSVSEGEAYTTQIEETNTSRFKQQRNSTYNNNAEDVVDFYQSQNHNSICAITKDDEEVNIFLPQQLMPAIPSETKWLCEPKPAQKPQPAESLYLATLKEKFESIKTLWDFVDEEQDPSLDVWEPLEGLLGKHIVHRPVSVKPQQPDEQPCRVAKSFLENNVEFNRGCPIEESIWSTSTDQNETCGGLFDDASFSDAQKNREICDNYERKEAFISSLGPAFPAVPAKPVKPAPSEDDGPVISLVNHSENSLFNAEGVTSLLIKPHQNNWKPHIETDETDQEVCDYLNSETTHFRPIVFTLFDGYSFEINAKVEKLDFYRSETGSLYLDSEKYMECSIQDGEIYNVGIHGGYPFNENFTVKVCVDIQNEKCCQTDFDLDDIDEVIDISWATSTSNDDQRWRYNEQILHDTKIDYLTDSNGNGNKGDGDDDNESKLSWGDGHDCANNNGRVWEACSTCNMQSVIPANRLLKDELRADGEAILSDLNYFHSLVIGNDWDNNDDDIVGKKDEMGQEEMESLADGIIDRNKVYKKVDKFVSDLLKPETTQTLAKALDGQNNWEAMAESDLLPFAYLFNSVNLEQHDKRKRKSCYDQPYYATTANANTEKREIKLQRPLVRPFITKAPPDKQLSSTDFLNLCNYIDAAKVWNDDGLKIKNSTYPICTSNLDLEIQDCVRKERKRRHDFDKSHDQKNPEKFSGTYSGLLMTVHDGGCINNDFFVDGFWNTNETSNLNFITMNAKNLAMDASFIFKNNNNLILKQIDIARPLTR